MSGSCFCTYRVSFKSDIVAWRGRGRETETYKLPKRALLREPLLMVVVVVRVERLEAPVAAILVQRLLFLVFGHLYLIEFAF
jgi:hypothetical protein